MNITNYLYVLISLLFFIIGIATGQDFLTEANFEDKTAKDIVAVEFWVEWNKSNEFSEFINLSDCEKYRVDIGRFPSLQAQYKVTCIPTVIIFESGEEKERFKANIMFKLEATEKDVQKSIDKIMLAKFE